MLGGKHMLAQMVLHHLRHQPVHGPTHGSDLAQDLGAGCLGLQCSFDAFHLAPDTAHASDQLLFLANGVGHGGWLGSLDYSMVDYSIWKTEGEALDSGEVRIDWQADGRPVTLGMTRMGAGPKLLLLPALSSISTRCEVRPLQERLAARFSTVAIDWPGFGDLPRPKIDWRPELYRSFLRFVLTDVVRPAATIAAGHSAGYALAQAAEDPATTGRLLLLSPTWRGPLPTMTGRRMRLFGAMAAMVDLPLVGPAFYRLNVNGPVIGMMARGHVYADPAWLTSERMAQKRLVTEAPGARHASFRFVAGELDLFADREAFLDTARRVGAEINVLYGSLTPRKSKAEMVALAGLANVTTDELPQGKLSFYEEFPDETAAAIIGLLAESR